MKRRTLIIAEAGVNHNGSVEIAVQLIKAAAFAKADVVKFQTFKSNLLATKKAQMAEYQKQNLKLGEKESNGSQLEMLKKLELSPAAHEILIKECKKLNIQFLSTCFDFESLEFLKTLNMGLWKIPSGEVTNLPYLEEIGKLNEPTILSTGMCEFQEVEAAINVLIKSGLSRTKITVLHCNTDYPTQMKDVNLLAMAELGRRLGIPYGYSDHTLGIQIPIAATALGASVIEKHFTISRKQEGPDHAASLEPEELKAMVESIRQVEEALGQNEKKPTESEYKNRPIARKSIVASRDIKKGEKLTKDNITTRRPGTGISPMKWYDVLGTTASEDYSEGDLI